MSILTDFFIASDKELAAAFPDRVPPKPEPAVRQSKNPFTGEPMTTREWLPAKPFPKRKKGANTADETEAVRKLRHVLATHVDNVKLAQLHCLLTGAKFADVISDFCRPALVAPDDVVSEVFVMPAEWVRALATLDKVAPVAKKWAATEECRTDGITAGDTAEVIESLRELARESIAKEKRFFLWLSP
jgi:hypothetical protein